MEPDQIWQEYRSALKGFLHSKVSNCADVEDLLQEILLKTFEKRDDLKDQQALKPWLFQVASNAITDHYRKKATRSDVSAAESWHTQETGSIEEELSNCIRPFVASLPPESADLLTKIDLEGVSQKELALKMGISYSTLKSRLRKGRSQMRKLYEDCCKMTYDQQGRIVDYHEISKTCKKC